MYFVTKEGKDKPLESNCKIPLFLVKIIVKLQLSDHNLQIKEENIPNLKNLFLKRKDLDDKKSQENVDKNVVNQVLDILKDKLMSNLKKMPSMYSLPQNKANAQGFSLSQQTVYN